MNQTEFELTLLTLWSQYYKKIYKYKNRINAFKEPRPNLELFYDINNEYFNELPDIATIDCDPEDGAVNISELIANRTT